MMAKDPSRQTLENVSSFSGDILAAVMESIQDENLTPRDNTGEEKMEERKEYQEKQEITIIYSDQDQCWQANLKRNLSNAEKKTAEIARIVSVSDDGNNIVINTDECTFLGTRGENDVFSFKKLKTQTALRSINWLDEATKPETPALQEEPDNPTIETHVEEEAPMVAVTTEIEAISHDSVSNAIKQAMYPFPKEGNTDYGIYTLNRMIIMSFFFLVTFFSSLAINLYVKKMPSATIASAIGVFISPWFLAIYFWKFTIAREKFVDEASQESFITNRDRDYLAKEIMSELNITSPTEEEQDHASRETTESKTIARPEPSSPPPLETLTPTNETIEEKAVRHTEADLTNKDKLHIGLALFIPNYAVLSYFVNYNVHWTTTLWFVATFILGIALIGILSDGWEKKNKKALGIIFLYFIAFLVFEWTNLKLAFIAGLPFFVLGAIMYLLAKTFKVTD